MRSASKPAAARRAQVSAFQAISKSTTPTTPERGRPGGEARDRRIGIRVAQLPHGPRHGERGVLAQQTRLVEVHAEAPAGGAVQPDRVDVVALQHDRPLPRRGVEQRAGRQVGPDPVAEAEPDERTSGGQRSRRGADERRGLGGGCGAAERQPGARERGLGDVHVLVPEAVQQPAPVGVQHLGAIRREPGRDRGDATAGEAHVDDERRRRGSAAGAGQARRCRASRISAASAGCAYGPSPSRCSITESTMWAGRFWLSFDFAVTDVGVSRIPTVPDWSRSA